ncbi:MAG: hypothetical protein IJQ97_06805 [Paludibacteraceae bacterium]|nr:hypothetical protein [Paludibacteraceae bacterium]
MAKEKAYIKSEAEAQPRKDSRRTSSVSATSTAAVCDLPDLTDPDTLRQAFIVSEILTPKY